MQILIRMSVVGLTVAGLLQYGTVGALAHSPIALTDGQLDRVTAGAGAVFSSTDAAAVGAFTLTSTTANSVVTAGFPYLQQPAAQNSVGAADGTAVAVGTNVTVPGNNPTGSATSVVTGGVADGNQVFSSTINHTFQGAGGVTVQAGWTFVYGAYIGL
jgi:hypothetical protein